MDGKLLTIAEIAKQLGIPESTVRFYRDRFEPFIPFVGEGRKKRYLPEAAEVLRFIAEAFKRNETATDIEEALSRVFSRTVEFHDETAMTTAAAQQQQLFVPSEQLHMLFTQFSAAMQTMADQKQEIGELRKQIADLRNEQAHQLERSKRLDEAMSSILEVRKEIAAIREQENRPWWKKIFK
ncbi:MerR family transcriptional regulator (plasmid) [Brevibacillus composti]|uniref:MerR family transcriptional regulator n=1 Tax=Brevibacillus composti TaxID=2796470 RepID=A0A7T5EQ72_9BACL|nr:MerR family transcriptional regulator [Brevibacillus composti]QQE76759.1 MerR family transcriptional regulator [Brevibacillus composti]QUO43822.1 MerR family transcriptional regulator [Brevibacillus composti]